MFMAQAVVEDLVQKLNEQLNLPFIPEGQEERVIRWVVNLISPHVPDWVVAFMTSAADGLTMEELKKHEDVIVNEVNSLLDIPWMPENLEELLIRPVIHQVLMYATEGNSIPD